MAKKKKKLYTRKYMMSYLNKYSDSAFRKLAQMKRSGTYKVSDKAQEANASLRSLYMKFDLDPDIMHKGKRFREGLKSNADLNILFKAVKKLNEIDAVAMRTKLRITRSRDKNFDKNFNILSQLSTDFHEVFAFISYNKVQEDLTKHPGLGPEDILAKYKAIISDKKLTDVQRYRSSRLDKKIAEYDKFNSKTIRYIMSSAKKRGGFKL